MKLMGYPRLNEVASSNIFVLATKYSAKLESI